MVIATSPKTGMGASPKTGVGKCTPGKAGLDVERTLRNRRGDCSWGESVSAVRFPFSHREKVARSAG